MKKIEERQFDVSIKEGQVLVMLSFAEKCGACETMKPIFEQFSNENPSIKCYQILYPFSLPAKPESIIAEKYNIGTFPAFLSFENGLLVAQMKGKVTDKALKLPFLSVSELKVTAYDCIEYIESVEMMKQDLDAINALISSKSNTPVKPTVASPVAPVVKKKR